MKRCGAACPSETKREFKGQNSTWPTSISISPSTTRAPLKDRSCPFNARSLQTVERRMTGVPLERVSVLLGHQSVKVTEKHYTPWVKARQEQLESDVRRTWN